MDAIRILIVDDHAVVRDGLSVMLGREEDFAVVGEARNGVEAVEQALHLKPDVVLMDLRMPELDGVEAMRRIGAEASSVKFLVLTTFDNDEYIFDAIEAGARGYLLKDTSREELFHAVRSVHQGRVPDPTRGGRQGAGPLRAELSRLAAQTPGINLLSEREVEVLQLMAKGTTNKAIAGALTISESTVKTHVANIFQKLDVRDRTEAVTQAVQKGIIKL